MISFLSQKTSNLTTWEICECLCEQKRERESGQQLANEPLLIFKGLKIGQARLYNTHPFMFLTFHMLLYSHISYEVNVIYTL